MDKFDGNYILNNYTTYGIVYQVEIQKKPDLTPAF